MTNVREGYSATILASLEWSSERERAVDRLAAAGLADELGVALWHARYCNESAAYLKARGLLVKRFLAHYKSEKPETAQRVCEEALSEWLGPACTTCNGARELLHEGLRITCDSCGGTGIKRYSDFERAGRMKMSMAHVRVLSHKLTWVAREIGTLDRQVNIVIATALERE